MPTVRLLGEADVPAYCALRREMIVDSPWAFLGAPGDDPPSQEPFIRDQWADPDNATAGSFEHDRLVGVASAMRSKRTKLRHRAMIMAVYCDPAARGRGHGRAVMDLDIRTAFAWDGVDVIGLSASERSPEAIRLYQSLGFTVWGVEPDVVRIDGASDNEVHMALQRSALPQT